MGEPAFGSPECALPSEFEILGDAVTQPSGVNRSDDSGKINYALIYDGPMIDRWAIHLTNAIPKRGKRNWMLGTTPEDMERFMESFIRHSRQYIRGDVDEDHAAAMFFNINGVEYVRSLAQQS